MLALTKKFISFKASRASKNSERRRQPVSYAQAKKVGVIFTVDDKLKHENIKKFIRQLELDKKEVETLSYVGKNKENFEFKFDFFTDEHISIWGSFVSENVIRFINKNFDYLFHIDLEPNIIMDQILAKSAAKCRIGNYHEAKSDYYEMMIKLIDEKNITELVNQMYHYTKSIVQ